MGVTRVAADNRQLVTSDGERIDIRVQDAHRAQAVVICPGFFQSKETRRFRDLASALAQRFDVVAMDFRGHGRSSGGYTFAAKEMLDLETVLAWARPQWARVGVLGFSLGGTIAVNEVAAHHNADSVIAVSAPMDFEEVENRWWEPRAIRQAVSNWDRHSGFRPGNFLLRKPAPRDCVDQLAPVPVLFIHGTDDPIIHHRHSEELYAHAQEPKRLALVPGGGHAQELFRQFPERFLGLVSGWFATTLSEIGQDAESAP
ncbi:MAG: alpha/beta fold hydrolase [Candidatus Omnitrophica bacterium]|nr:alpha/beta fold hydrolase [Candidatus Omnitrophota bacterium]